MTERVDLAAKVAELERALAESKAQLAARDTELATQRAFVEQLSADVTDKSRTIADLQHRLDLLARQLFGCKAERVDPRQLKLAFELALERDEIPPSFVGEAPDEESDTKPKKRCKQSKRNGRAELPANLPRERAEIHPPADQLVCPCGCERRKIGEEVTELLDYQPASFKVVEHARIKYACPRCQEGVVCPDLPAFPIDKLRPSRPGAGLLAELIVNKYGDHLPLSRLEGVFERHGVRIAKSTLCDWIRDVADLLDGVVQEIKREVLQNSILQTDETGIRVRDPTLHHASRSGRIWVYAGLPGQVYFEYTPTKEGKHVEAFLEHFEGYLQADAYSGFDRLYQDGSIVEVACWAHARRKFFDAKDASPVEAAWALQAIGQLFKLEREASEGGLSVEARLEQRQEKAKPLVDSFFEWLEPLKGEVVPKSPLHKAVTYALNQRQALERFLEDGRLKLDNNRAERSLRQVAVGRKNWLFAGSPKGAARAAKLYSLVVSCRELKINVFEYLQDVILKAASPDFPASRIGELTPRGWAALHS